MKKSVEMDLPYPSMDGVVKDLKSAAIIAPAYDGGHGELKLLLQYIYHYLNFKSLGDKESSDLVMEILATEINHFILLGELIYKLGAAGIVAKMPPRGYNYCTSAGVTYSKTPIKMLIDDVSSEILSVNQYEKMVREIKNPAVTAIIERILMDEKLHIKLLKERIISLGGKEVRVFNCIM